MMLAQKTIHALVVACALTALTTLGGCVQYPTERQNVVDLRPQVSFQFNPEDARLLEARVQVDGLDAGRLGDFIDGKSALRVLPGTHVIKVVMGDMVLLEERVYLGDGVSRAMVVR
jgi:hypothetical protein